MTRAAALEPGTSGANSAAPAAPAAPPPGSVSGAVPAAQAPAANLSVGKTVPAQSISVSAAVRAAVDAPDRSPEDKALDVGRHPAEMLSFFGIAPGQRVAELFAGGGYTTELLARIVGERGKVFGQNSRYILERFADAPWSQRLKKPVMRHVARVDRELEAPLPAEATPLDAVLFVLSYHDSVWMKTDRAAMNRSVFNALRPGGVYGIVDHSARAGSGVSEAQTNHRIDEATLVAEVLAAGFRLDAQTDLLRNPADTRDWNGSPGAAGERRGTTDRFVLRFVRP